jgi:hypothetical protein
MHIEDGSFEPPSLDPEPDEPLSVPPPELPVPPPEPPLDRLMSHALKPALHTPLGHDEHMSGLPDESQLPVHSSSVLQFL